MYPRHNVVASVVLLLLFQEYVRIVLVRQASNPHENIVISGLHGRIFARILVLGFSLAALSSNSLL